MARNPIKDQIAIVGIGTTGFTRSSDHSSLALALDASTKAIRDAGLTAADINGVVAINEPGAPGPDVIATALGLTDVTHFTRPTPVVMNSIVDAMNFTSPVVLWTAPARGTYLSGVVAATAG